MPYLAIKYHYKDIIAFKAKQCDDLDAVRHGGVSGHKAILTKSSPFKTLVFSKKII